MRASLVINVVVVLLLTGAQSEAQVVRSAESASLLPPPSAFDLATETENSLSHRVFSGLGSALLGAGVGFFASQIDRSDWEEVPGVTQSNRGLWAALGGGLGFAVGFSFPVGLSSPPTGAARVAGGGREVITPSEISDVSADNAYDLVRLLRPEWLRVRLPDQFGEVESETVTVYLEDFRYGDSDSLRRIHAQTIASMRFVPPAMATARWGTGHVMGAIQVRLIPDRR